MTFISCVRFVGHIKSLFERTNGCHNPQKVVCRHKVHFKFKQIIQQSCYPIFKTFFMSQQAPFMGDIYWTILALLHHYYKARGNGWRFSGSTNRSTSKSCYYLLHSFSRKFHSWENGDIPDFLLPTDHRSSVWWRHVQRRETKTPCTIKNNFINNLTLVILDHINHHSLGSYEM